MLKFTSISDSDFRVITDTTLTVTIIRTGITPDLITARTIGTADIIITAIIIPIIHRREFDRNSHTGLARRFSSQPNFRATAR